MSDTDVVYEYFKPWYTMLNCELSYACRVCHSKGIPVREVAPSWERHQLWEEAFITNSLRVLQHVETIKVPRPWESLESKCLEGISWVEKKFQGPGIMTKVIQKEIMERVSTEGHWLKESV
ncbi:uncharacterized protein LOC120182473 [Hibiscus syriacus]|uniref:uncharacterized protein LOC120182473 n=1 Tax=Hibiscus syriacus TaxID=106335 RepID=UPI0019217616|nr:uncharacterized protein LOC120182473 [Hibiscus syriacus]